MNARRNIQPGDVFSFGPFSLSVAGRLLKRDDETIPLGGRALDVLIALMERAGEVVSYSELISLAWPNVTVDEANLRVQIATLRKALGGEEGARYISNVAGRGYCFVAPVSCSTEQLTVAGGSPDGEQPRKLPPPLARMVGRDEAVRAVSEQLVTDRFVSIVGPGGIGKTTVAISVAHALLSGFSGAVSFVDLSALTNAQLVPAAVASALGFMIQAHDPYGSLVAFLGDRKILLVLDNCEHVIDAAAKLAERVVGEAPQAHILATSREALRVEGERVHLLYSLDCPPAENADLTAAEVLRFPAAQLFMERAVASGYRAALSDVDAPTVAMICRRLDGIALAIELAGGRAGSLGIRGISELLDNRFSMLWHGRRTALPRHQTLNAMLDWSYNLLPDHEKAVFRRLSVFVGDFTIEAACAVASGTDLDEARVAETVQSLLGKSLMSTTQAVGSVLHRLLDTTRAYARAKLDERGEVAHVARLHAEFYFKFLQSDEILRSRIGKHDLSVYAPHISNVRAALEWALSDRGDSAFGVALVAQAAPLLLGLSLLEECRRFCERALAVIDDTGDCARTEMILQESLALASMYTRGNHGTVRAAIDRGLALAEALGDRSRQLQLLASLNLLLVRKGDLQGARAAVERGRSVAQAISDPAGLIWAEWMIGVSHHVSGDQAAAQSHLERGMSLAAELGSHHANYFGTVNRIGAIVALARVLWLRGFPDRATGTALKAIEEMSCGRNHPVSVCTSLLYGGSVIFWTGDFSRAWKLVEQLIEFAGRHSLGPYRAAGIGLKGELQVASDEVRAGIQSLREALEIMQVEQYNVVRGTLMGALAGGLLKVGDLEDALITVNSAISRSIETGAEFDLPELLRIKGQIFAARKDHLAAITCVRESIAKARTQHALSLELRSAMTLARLFHDGGESAEVRQCVAGVYDRFTEGFDTADLKVAHAIITE